MNRTHSPVGIALLIGCTLLFGGASAAEDKLAALRELKIDSAAKVDVQRDARGGEDASPP